MNHEIEIQIRFESNARDDDEEPSKEDHMAGDGLTSNWDKTIAELWRITELIQVIHSHQSIEAQLITIIPSLLL